MTNKDYFQLSREASEQRQQQNFDRAGVIYTSTAYNSLGKHIPEYMAQLASGLTHLLSASLCFRLAGADQRAANRAKQGELLVEDAREHVATSVAERGVTYEYSGDFRVIGEFADYKKPYRRAAEAYEMYEQQSTINERVGQLSEEIFHNNTLFLRRIRRALDVEIPEELASTIEFHSPVKRIEYKQDQFPDLVAALVSQGEYEW